MAGMEKLILTVKQREELVRLMRASARKGNLANAAMVLQRGKMVASAESWVVSSCDATAHSERMLVEQVCKARHSHFTPGLTMVTVVEPCLMCLSACAWAGYECVVYLIPAKRYQERIPWVTDNAWVNKRDLASNFTNPLELVHGVEYEAEFARVFEREMAATLKD